MKRITTSVLLEALRDVAGATPMSYSGRGMYGRYCLAARVEGCLVAFGAALQRSLGSGYDVPAARIDNLGHDTVVYWPDLADEGVLSMLEDADDDYEEDETGTLIRRTPRD